ncbi:hypothetical protein GALL_433730 [mine drainage metagenome]|uniref:Uncharacterized protein n=1 Tax=mine drainage metagenome TaxID=410659 RepID=A0A1J5Q4X9_9ZZZZ
MLSGVGDDNAVGDAGLVEQGGFDFARLDAKAAHRDLMIEPAEVFKQSVMPPAAQIAGLVEQGVWCGAEGIGDEALGGEVRSLEIAQCHAGAADMHFSWHADGARLTVVVENPHAGVGDGAADRHALSWLCHLPAGGPHRGFGRAIQVPDFAAALQQALGEFSGQCLAADERTQAGVAGPAGIEQDAPGRGRRLHHRCAAPFQQGAQGVRIAGLRVAGEHDPRAGGERKQQLQHGNVERQGGHGEQDISGPHPRRARHAGEEIDHRAVRHLHALGPPGGARGVDHVGRVFGLRVACRVGRQRRGRVPGGQCCLVEREQRHIDGIEQVGERGLDEDGGKLRIGGHVTQALLRIGRIERNIGRAGLEHSEHSGEHVDVAWQTEAHLLPATDAARTQRPREGIRSGFEVGVAQGMALDVAHGLARAVVRGGRGQIPMRHERCRQGGVGRVPVAQQRLLLRGDQGISRQRPGRVGQHLADEVEIAVEQALRGIGREQVGGIFELDAVRELGVDVDRQIELRGDAVEVEPGVVERHGGELAQGGVEHVEQHVHQPLRMVCALLVHALDQFIEGRVLMCEGPHRGVPHTLDQAVKTHVVLHFGPQDERIDQGAEQVLGHLMVAVCDGRADRDIGALRQT